MDTYYETLLGQILAGEQQVLEDMIDLYFEEGCYCFEGIKVYNFKSLRIYEAVEFLKDNYEYLKDFIQ